MRSGYRSPGLVEAAVCVVRPFGPVQPRLMLIAVASLALPFSHFEWPAVLMPSAIALAIIGTTYVLAATRTIVTFDEAQQRVTLQRALWPLRGRVRTFDLAATNDAHLLTDGSKVRLEIVNEHGVVDDAITVDRSDVAALQFVERVVAAVGMSPSET